MFKQQIITKPALSYPLGYLSLKTFVSNFSSPARFASTAIKENTKTGHQRADNVEFQKRPAEEDYKIYTKPTFSHPPFLRPEMELIHYEHRPQTTMRDWYANWLVRVLRFGFDLFTGYKHVSTKEVLEEGKPYPLSTEKWMIRIIFLESIAGVPGAVGGFLRHLHSLRLLRRDKLWIETLIEESYNERMHLLTFIAISKPSLVTRCFIKLAQGVFTNLFFLSYLATPTTCHRFVGYLEEEAIKTYSTCLEDMDLGLLPEFSALEVPPIAKLYWNMPEDSTMRDLILYVRADEAKHREVNHTLANLKQDGTDRNPFAHTIAEDGRPQPTADLSSYKGTGWEREEILYVDEKKRL